MKVSWDRAKGEGALEGYREEVKNRLTPFLNSVYSSVQEIGSEIGQVSSILVECGLHTLLLTNGRRRHRWKDEVLNSLCAQSKNAWKVWAKAGRPPSGPEFDEKCRLRREVRWRVRFCAASTQNWWKSGQSKTTRIPSSESHNHR